MSGAKTHLSLTKSSWSDKWSRGNEIEVWFILSLRFGFIFGSLGNYWTFSPKMCSKSCGLQGNSVIAIPRCCEWFRTIPSVSLWDWTGKPPLALWHRWSVSESRSQSRSASNLTEDSSVLGLWTRQTDRNLHRIAACHSQITLYASWLEQNPWQPPNSDFVRNHRDFQINERGDKWLESNV